MADGGTADAKRAASGLQSVGPGPVAAPPPGNWSEMQTPRPYFSPLKSDSLGVGTAICALTSLPGNSDASSSLRAAEIQTWNESI